MTTLAVSFLVYSIGIAAFGFLSTRFARGSEADFLLADRGLGAWVAGLSAAASAESGWVTLGLVGKAYENGLHALWIVPGTLAAFVFNWCVLAPRLQRASHEDGALTVTDVLALRWTRSIAVAIRLVAIAVILSMLTGYVASQFKSAGVAFKGSFGWSYETGVIIGGVLVLAYTVTGGFRAIAWTDVVQSIFMIGAVIVVPVLLIRLIGGVDEFVSRARVTESLMDPFAGKTGSAALLAVLGFAVGIPLGNTGQPHMLVRILATKDATARRRAAVISTTWVAVLFLGAIALGMSARVYYGASGTGPVKAEETLPFVAADANVVHPIVGGMMVAAILAAICSTADSQLLVAASSISHDLLVRVRGKAPSTGQRRMLDRGAIVLLSVVAIGLALINVQSVFSAVLTMWDTLGATFGPALMLLFLHRRATGKGVLAAMLTGATVSILFRHVPALSVLIYASLPAFIAALIVGWGVNVATSDDAVASTTGQRG